MGVGEGALRPCALDIEVSRPVSGLAFPERVFWLLVPTLQATKESRPLPGRHGNMGQDQRFQGVEYMRSTVMGEQEKLLRKRVNRRERNREMVIHKIILP